MRYRVQQGKPRGSILHSPPLLRSSEVDDQAAAEYTAMPHCTSNFAWYLTKFLTGFTGMLFFYVCFLKEKEYSCLCKARSREFFRDRGGNTNPCTLDDQTGANVRQEGRPRFMLVVAENLWTWYAGMREWFLENDPAISETALVLGKDPPKNDNGNFDFSSESLRIARKLYVLCNIA
ncbi:uncharacterized protein LOC143362863 [Halictus rubicundus]|uniref:uncharacterized protein LOC143362863 n=1 Tax=Halictus rubicundus TaxID=77578 RepID=UPI00403669B1